MSHHVVLNLLVLTFEFLQSQLLGFESQDVCSWSGLFLIELFHVMLLDFVNVTLSLDRGLDLHLLLRKSYCAQPSYPTIQRPPRWPLRPHIWTLWLHGSVSWPQLLSRGLVGRLTKWYSFLIDVFNRYIKCLTPLITIDALFFVYNRYICIMIRFKALISIYLENGWDIWQHLNGFTAVINIFWSILWII